MEVEAAFEPHRRREVHVEPELILRHDIRRRIDLRHDRRRLPPDGWKADARRQTPAVFRGETRNRGGREGHDVLAARVQRKAWREPDSRTRHSVVAEHRGLIVCDGNAEHSAPLRPRELARSQRAELVGLEPDYVDRGAGTVARRVQLDLRAGKRAPPAAGRFQKESERGASKKHRARVPTPHDD
jgi:hypothetical protein